MNPWQPGFDQLRKPGRFSYFMSIPYEKPHNSSCHFYLDPMKSLTMIQHTCHPQPQVQWQIEAQCEHTSIPGALVENPQGNLEEIQQRNPAEHPRGTCRPSGSQGLDVRHRALRSHPRTASADAGGAIRTPVPVTSPPRPLLRGRTYLRTIPGASQAIGTYLVRTCTYTRLVQRRGRFQYYNVLCSKATSPVRRPMLSHSGAPGSQPVPTVPGNREIRKVLRRLRKICRTNVFKASPR
jgi:hypothetical protein